jgi:hypothetical protein
MGQSFAFQSIVAKPFKINQGGVQRRGLWKGVIVEWKYFLTDGDARNEARSKGV